MPLFKAWLGQKIMVEGVEVLVLAMLYEEGPMVVSYRWGSRNGKSVCGIEFKTIGCGMLDFWSFCLNVPIVVVAAADLLLSVEG